MIKPGEDPKYAAKRELAAAIKRGELRPEPCAVCGTKKDLQAHHPSYAPEDLLKVVWLCRDHHAAEHNRLKWEARKLV